MLKNPTGKSGEFKSHSMFSCVFIPIMALLIFQALLYGLFFWRGNVIEHINQNAFDIFNEHAINSSRDLQSLLSHISQSVNESAKLITDEAEAVIKQNKAEYDSVFTDCELNKKIISQLATELMEQLDRNDVNGVFMVLDGPLNNPDSLKKSARAGIYIRKLDRTAIASDNSHILLERGMPELAKNLNIALDTYWSAGFEFSDETSENEFFFEPINAARNAKAEGKSSYYGKWSGCHSISPNDIPVLSYSVPMVLKDGTVIGAIGMDVTDSALSSIMPYQNLSANGDAAYFLGVSTDGGKSYEKATYNGALYRYHFSDSDYIMPYSYSDSHPDIFYTGDSEGCAFFGVIKPLNMYVSNTPFENEQWALIGLVEKDVLLYFSKELSSAAIFSLLLSLAAGFVGVFIVMHIFTTPIRRIIYQLRTGNPMERSINLEKLGINEIDELTVSIENLSMRIADNSERVARLFAIAPVDIGIFEYDRKSPSVFCSAGLCRLLCWPETSEKEYVFIDRHEFESRLARISRNLLTTKQMQFSITVDGKSTRWMRADTVLQGGTVIGAVTDITSEVAAKNKIEFERDYDTLTGLYNLRAFNAKYSAIFSTENLKTACLVMWDLDNLKHINDTYGHDFGDRYIQSFSQCLEFFSDNNALVARRSGDEFYVFLYGFDSKDEITDIINVVWDKINAQTILLPDSSRYKIRVSGGIAWYPDDSKDSEELLRYADFAMYNAKHSLKGTISRFDYNAYRDNAHILDGYEVISRLIEGELVKFAMQPIVSAKDGSIYGYEMLMRPQIPGENYSPLEILKMAQIHSKLYHIERISFFKGMETFIEQILFKNIPDNSRVFLNSLANQAMTEEDIDIFENAFAKYLDRIVIEITESEQENEQCSRRKNERVERWNARIAIDDYGSGYNSESTLIALHPHIVKVDMSILRGIDKDPNRQTMLESLISYAKKFNVAILAEGIETEQELETVIARGVDYIQGYYVGKPNFEPAPIPEYIVAKITETAEKYSR